MWALERVLHREAASTREAPPRTLGTGRSVTPVSLASSILRELDMEAGMIAAALADGLIPEADYRSAVRERRGLLRAREIVTAHFSDEERSTFGLNPRQSSTGT